MLQKIQNACLQATIHHQIGLTHQLAKSPYQTLRLTPITKVEQQVRAPLSPVNLQMQLCQCPCVVQVGFRLNLLSGIWQSNNVRPFCNPRTLVVEILNGHFAMLDVLKK